MFVWKPPFQWNTPARVVQGAVQECYSGLGHDCVCYGKGTLHATCSRRRRKLCSAMHAIAPITHTLPLPYRSTLHGQSRQCKLRLDPRYLALVASSYLALVVAGPACSWSTPAQSSKVSVGSLRLECVSLDRFEVVSPVIGRMYRSCQQPSRQASSSQRPAGS